MPISNELVQVLSSNLHLLEFTRQVSDLIGELNKLESLEDFARLHVTR